MTAPDLIIVGKIGRTRGVFGDLYVAPSTDFPDRFLGLKEIFVGNRNNWEKMILAATSIVGGRPVIRFEGVESREDAARLTNRDLAVPREQVIGLPEGSFYIFDLIGCKIYENGTDKLLGEITDVEQFPANDVYIVRTIEGKEMMVPAARDFVLQIAIDSKRVVVAPGSLLDRENP